MPLTPSSSQNKIAKKSPNAKRINFNVRVPSKLAAKVRKSARADKRSVSKQVEYFLEKLAERF